tara:strand:+ start:5567 stop:6205 length:639 start_codon:yes stop_codon:yes gene_type:complete
MASILKVDKIRGTGLDSDTISLDGTGNITFPKNVTFSGTVTGTATVKLLDATISSAVSAYDISSTHINATYDDYIMSFTFKPASDGVKLYSRVFIGGVLQTGAIYAYETSSPVHGSTNSNGNDYFIYTHDNTGNSTGEAVSGRIHLKHVNNTSFNFNYEGGVNSYSTSGSHGGYNAFGSLINTQASSVINGYRFYFNSGDISSGTVKLYGIK